MKAIILAAGRGSRMKGLTESNPKCLVELKGKPLLSYQLAAIQAAGIKDIAVVTGYRKEMLTSFGLTEFHNKRWAETNMVSSLSTAKSWLQNDDCIVSYSDIFYDDSAVTSLLNTEADIALTYDPNWLEIWSSRFDDPLSDAETFRKNLKGELLEIGKRPQTTEQVQGQYMGLLKFTPKGWHALTQQRALLSSNRQDSIHMTDMLQLIVESKTKVIKTVPYTGSWGEVDSEEDLKCYL